MRPVDDGTIAAAITAASEVRVRFASGDEAYVTPLRDDGAHVLVRARGERHPVRVRRAIIVGVTSAFGGRS